MSLQDLFKSLADEEASGESRKVLDRKAINLARMLSHLVANFVMSLSLLKTIDMDELSAPLLLFLATFFMGLFSAQVRHQSACPVRLSV